METTPSALPPAAHPVSIPDPHFRPALLPTFLSSPWALVFCLVPAQVILLLINAQVVGLGWSDMNDLQKTQVEILGGALALSIGLFLGRAIWSSRPFSLVECGLVLVSQGTYLWFSTAWLGSNLLPNTVARWMVQPEDLILYQFTLIGPAIGYALLRLSCLESSRFSLSKNLLGSLAVAAGIPLLLCFLIMFLQSIGAMVPHGVLEKILVPTVIIPSFILAALLSLGAVIRLCASLVVWAYRQGTWGVTVLALTVGIVLPLGGLLLNIRIPFPYNFQSTTVYVLTLLNGLLLLVPLTRHAGWNRALWLGQCASFPFSAYFMMVFLPFLPFSLIAMVALGAGFLILAPLVLFVVHSQILVAGWQRECDRQNRWSPTLQAVTALLVLPALYTLQILADRQALHSGLDYVYRSAYQANVRYPGHPRPVQRSLEHLRDFKAGLGLPFISDYYSWIVFDNLVLSNEKMQQLHRIFTGRELPESKPDAMANLLGTQSRSANFRSRASTPPPAGAILQKLEFVISVQGPITRVRLTATVHNANSQPNEFATSIHLDPGVVVTDYVLHIGNERVPGRLFEKKSALWVYEKIRNDTSQRDPGLVIYRSAEELDFRIFPVESQKTRTAEIEFSYPASQHPKIQFGDREVVLKAPAPAETVLASFAQDGFSFYFPSGLAQSSEAIIRRPYLHLLVDTSATAALSEVSVQKAIRECSRLLPACEHVVVTAVNYESVLWQEFFGNPSSFPSLKPVPLSTRGGFWPERAIHTVLKERQTRTEQHLAEYPLFVVLTSHWKDRVPETNPRREMELSPDIAGFLLVEDQGPQFIRWSGDWTKTEPVCPPTVPVLLFARGSILQIIPAQTPGQMMHFPGVSTEPPLLYQNSTKTFRSLPQVQVLVPSDPYSAALNQWRWEKQLWDEPEQEAEWMQKISASSQTSRVLTPSLAYIVVENKAQWKMLEAKQKQKLANGHELDLEEAAATPEPTTWLLLLMGLVLLCGRSVIPFFKRFLPHGLS